MWNFDVTGREGGEIGSIRVRSAPKFGDKEILTWRFRPGDSKFSVRSAFRGDWVRPDSESRSVGTRRGLILFRFFSFSDFFSIFSLLFSLPFSLPFFPYLVFPTFFFPILFPYLFSPTFFPTVFPYLFFPTFFSLTFVQNYSGGRPAFFTVRPRSEWQPF